MLRRVGLSLAILVCLASSAFALPVIVLGNYNMPAGTTGNVIDVFVTSDVTVQGLNFIMDSNSNAAGGPLITAVDIVGAGTVFFGNNTGQGGTPAPPALKIKQTTTTASGSVGPWASPSLLAHVTFSTVGVNTGVYALRIKGMATSGGGATTSFAVVALDQNASQNGTITVVPEPTTLVLGLFAAAGLGAVAIRNRRRKAA